ncbi:PD-(D/E)XK motif protein [Stenotrophomonas maltophilia]|uniref:PD-(D/E)XK motif protein n=1 Tax=Stenotrophomonas maltophilia TaxID=40324 RepID=A0A4S2D593_STEMA|nr:PD-(D/E)XK motif protein [Stenotrophomonas maltophilia]TGY35763.1 PD-(D/E)XK motif protein [Stenotrophomonas maltophilia]
MKAESPHDVWVGLRSSSVSDNVIEIASVPSTVQTGYGPVRYALDEAGSPRLLIPCARIAGLEELTKLGGASISVRISNLHGRIGRALYIDLVLTAQGLSKVFSELCQEILSRISAGGNPVEAVASTVRDFRMLLADPSAQPVSESSIGGLVGELVFLRRITRNGTGSASSWTGPLGQRHDFRTRRGAVEVKTSLRKATTQVSIHGIEQLSAPADVPLWLAHIKIERASSGRLSVSALFDSLVSQGLCAQELSTRLAAIGCDDPHSIAWNFSSYELEAFDLYEVTEGFPKLDSSLFSSGNLPLGISGLTYQIDLSAGRDYLIKQSEQDRLLDGMSE